MDRSLFPDIFALTVFIVGFRPLARRVGPHANLWVVGWTLVLVHRLALMFYLPTKVRGTIISLVATYAIEFCGLVFLAVAANVPKERISRLLLVMMGLPVLTQSTLFVLDVSHGWMKVAGQMLYLAPVLCLALRPRERSRPIWYVTTGFAVVGPLTIPLVLRGSVVAAQFPISLLLLSAAYLFYISAERHTRGVVMATVGLAGWGLTDPLASVLPYVFPGVTLDRALMEPLQYMVFAGMMLTLLEEHVERTERMAMHDPLTDLPNRRMFEERLIATMEEARLQRTTVACLVIDVDNFKTINDTLGHSAGDQLLRALAVRLSWHMSPRDILARTGGDEFTALLAGVTDEHHLRFIASAMMSAGSVPISVDGKAVDVRISIGIALSPDHADDIDSLRRAADQAMYTAKRRGGSMLAFADED